jgi:sterol desaturase/sphingolipid hydroxylase (fatty acid hydroxylase superfamily)
MNTLITEVLQWWTAIYGGLLLIYFAACLVISRLNDSAPGRARSIRTTPQPQQRPLREQISAAVISLAGISLLLATGVAMNRAGLALYPNIQLSWTTAGLAFLLSMVLYDASFYWIHRTLHRPALFKRIHFFHHQVTAPVPWTTNSELLIDGMLINSYWLLAPLLLPIPINVLLLHRAFDLVMGVLGHSGHEYGAFWVRPPSPLVSVTHHDQHHQYFHCNYAVHFTCWDRLMKTLHPTHDSVLLKR